MKTILAIDGNSVINRAYFGMRPLTNGKGQRTEAIYGMLNIILAQMEERRPDCVMAAFDFYAPTFRHKIYDAYKGTRKGMDEELAVQMEPAKELLRALGCLVLEKAGYEADDILGTIAHRCDAQGDRCYILTGDRDSLQLVSENTTVLLISKGETVPYTPGVFRERYGIDPGQFVDAKALMGDSSDNIPGVPGVGEKTALPLIASFGSLDGVYAHLDDPSVKAGLRTKLAEGKESAYLSQTLSRILTDVPVDLDFSDRQPRPDLYDVLSDLEFTSAIARLNVSRGADVTAQKRETVYEKTTAEKILSLRGKLGVFWTDDALYVSGCEGDLLLEAPDENTLRAFFAPGRQIAVCDCKSVYHRLFALGVYDFEAGDDPTLAAYVLSSTDGDYSPAALARRFLQTDIGEDARTTLELSDLLAKKLEEEGCAELYKTVELPLAGVLARCEDAGFLVDREGISAFGELLKTSIDNIAEQVYDLAGEEFNINSPKQLGAILFDKLGLSVYGMKKNKNGYSTSAEILEKMKYDHPVVSGVLAYRQLSKLRSTYTEGLLKVAGEDGRVHTSFTQTVTATGRLSSIEPNLQNIPVRTELGRELRRFFIAPAGRVLIDADYSQIELRLLAHLSGDPTMTDAFRSGVDIHAATASEVFGVPPSMVTPEMRKKAKAVNFGIVYGISAFSLADDIKVSRKEAENYIASYFATYPGIERWLQGEVEKAKEQGYVTTMFGRRRYIPELTSGKGQLKKFGERVAMNSPVQGSAADIIKIAMVRADRMLRESGLDAHLVLQVHDELIVEASEKDAARASELLRAAMEDAAKLSVPLTVDLNAGRSWYDCK